MIQQENDLLSIDGPANDLPIIPVHLRPDCRTLVKTDDGYIIQVNIDGTMKVIQWPIIQFTFKLCQPTWSTQ